MKRIILIALMAICCISSTWSQKILLDNISTIGGKDVRIVTTTSETFRSFSDVVVMSVCMMATRPEGSQDIEYTMCINLKSSLPISAPASARMLFKTFEEENMAFEESGNVEKEDHLGKLQKAGNMTVKTFEIDLLYKLSREDIEKLGKGIRKVRIETNGEKPYEKEWKKDKLGKFVKKGLKLIDDSFAGKFDKRDSFYDDF